MTLWNRGYARAQLMGAERTSNPTPAAYELLKSKLGPRRVKAAVKRAGRRRSFFRGNPIPAAVGIIANFAGLGGRFKTPSEKRAAGVAGQLVNAAVQGNLTAAKAILERTEIGIQKERKVWRAAAAQIPPTILALVKKYEEKIPGVDHSTPEAAGETALARAVNGLELEHDAAEAAEAARAKVQAAAAGRRSAAAAERAQTLGVVQSLGTAGLQALAQRGRSLRQPSRRRRTSRSKRR